MTSHTRLDKQGRLGTQAEIVTLMSPDVIIWLQASAAQLHPYGLGPSTPGHTWRTWLSDDGNETFSDFAQCLKLHWAPEKSVPVIDKVVQPRCARQVESSDVTTSETHWIHNANPKKPHGTVHMVKS
jgi:hypothetical protein